MARAAGKRALAVKLRAFRIQPRLSQDMAGLYVVAVMACCRAIAIASLKRMTLVAYSLRCCQLFVRNGAVNPARTGRGFHARLAEMTLGARLIRVVTAAAVKRALAVKLRTFLI